MNRSEKRQRPKTSQINWLVKTKRRPIIASAITSRLLKTTLSHIMNHIVFLRVIISRKTLLPN